MGGIFTHPPFKHRLIDSQSAVGVGEMAVIRTMKPKYKGKEVGSFRSGGSLHPDVISNSGRGGVLRRGRDVCRG